MKRLTTNCRTLVLATLAVAPLAALGDDERLEAVRTKVTEMFTTIERDDIGASPVDGWYTIQKGSIIAYISDDGRYLLQGDLIDLDTQVNLSEQRRNDLRHELMRAVDDSESIIFAPAGGKAEHTVTVFTDVDCVYCRRLHAEIDKYLANGIAVRYLLYPRGGPASPSWNTSENVWCASDRQQALTLAKLDREFETSKCDAGVVQEHYALGEQVGLSGTPAIVLEDGELIAGYLPPDALKARLDGKNGGGTTPQAASTP